MEDIIKIIKPYEKEIICLLGGLLLVCASIFNWRYLNQINKGGRLSNLIIGIMLIGLGLFYLFNR